MNAFVSILAIAAAILMIAGWWKMRTDQKKGKRIKQNIKLIVRFFRTVSFLFDDLAENLFGDLYKLIQDGGTGFPVYKTNRPFHVHFQRDGPEGKKL